MEHDPAGGEPSRPVFPDAAERAARTWAMASHLAGFAMYTGIPLASVLGPFVVWQLKREDHPLIDDQGREAVNFQITMAIAVLVSIALMFCVVGFFVLPVLGVWHVVLMVIAGVKAQQGHYYRYPLCLRLVH